MYYSAVVINREKNVARAEKSNASESRAGVSGMNPPIHIKLLSIHPIRGEIVKTFRWEHRL